MKTRIVPASEISSKSLLAEDYVGGPGEPGTEGEEAYKFCPPDISYWQDQTKVTACCGTAPFVPDDPDEGPHPQCATCGEEYPKLVDPGPAGPADPGDTCGGRTSR